MRGTKIAINLIENTGRTEQNSAERNKGTESSARARQNRRNGEHKELHDRIIVMAIVMAKTGTEQEEAE